jgi:hypothetical protein
MGLDAILKQIVGQNRVYFQPPEGFKLSYPCIVYELSGTDTKYADNYPYAFFNSYQITLIDKDPDSAFREELLKLQASRFTRSFRSDGMYHYVFEIYY